MLPNENMYASVLCGSLSMVVQVRFLDSLQQAASKAYRAQATANHKDIAETLSTAVTDLCKKASNCTNILQVVNTNEMKHHIADVYAQLFTFLGDVMKWNLSSKTKRFLQASTRM